MKTLFVYNDYNDVRGISNVMEVAERYAFRLGDSEVTEVTGFNHATGKHPTILMKDGSLVEVAPVSKGLILDFSKYDKVYVDSTVSTFMEVSHFGNKIDFYNKDSFKN